jgi:uncharacterized membrane protein YkoI
MNTKIIVSTVSAGLLIASSVSFADDDMLEMQRYAEGLNLISVELAQANALKAKQGVVDDIDLENRQFSKGWDYEFEIVDIDGAEWEVTVDAKTGEVTQVEKDWF